MTRTAEQLEELMAKYDNGYGLDPGRAADELWSIAPSLARRVIAAEKLVEALEKSFESTVTVAVMDRICTALTAYREAGK